MVDVGDVERQREIGRECTQDVEKRDRIGAARHRDQDTFAASEHRVAANGVARGGRETQPPCNPTHTSPSSKCSFFHTGTVRLSVSIAY